LSEYQYYEFLAVDRPLDERQQAEVRTLFTRARVTATSFTNEYHWSNFRGDPRTMMERYYDARLYLTSWGTHQVMLRLPAHCSAWRPLGSPGDRWAVLHRSPRGPPGPSENTSSST